MPSVAGPRPPFGRPGPRCPPVRCPPVRCPAVRCPAVRCPAAGVSSRWGVRPSALPHPSRPASAGRWRLGTCRYGGATVTTGTSRVPCGPAPVPPAARSTVRVSLDVGNAAEVVYRPARERRPRPCPGGAWAGRLLPTDQGGQTAAGVPRRWRRGSGRESWVKRDVPALRVAASLAWSCDYAPWSLWSLTPEWTGPEGHELDGEDGRTAPARPSQVAGPPSSTPTAL
jgi:hypothetical protein